MERSDSIKYIERENKENGIIKNKELEDNV